MDAWFNSKRHYVFLTYLCWAEDDLIQRVANLSSSRVDFQLRVVALTLR